MLRVSRIVTGAALALLLTAGAGRAEDSLIQFRSLTPELAVKAAQAALAACRTQGFQVAVAVLDRGGNVQALIRDTLAGPHTPETATRKAWTAVSFRADTTGLSASLADGKIPADLRNIPGALFLGGGVKVEAAGAIVAGIGVSGAPSGSLDEGCAKTGIAAIADALNF